ncbi:hypothetical protein PQX77_012014 [Marasmius sp. AFHP31]|nr:hypothetical protein PQX77_012014 [Marasmius sp. AFHP31]
MFKYHFDILHRDEFEDDFRYKEAINGEYRLNTCWVLELAFSGLDMEVENFDMNDGTQGLKRFVDKYRFLESIGQRWEELGATVVVETFDNILDAIMDGKHTIVVLMTDLFGRCGQDIVNMAGALDYQFHGLHADEWADESLESQEGKDDWEKLGEKIKDLPDVTPYLKLSLRYKSEKDPR